MPVSGAFPYESVECVLPLVGSRLDGFHPDGAVRIAEDLGQPRPLQCAAAVSPHADADDTDGARDDVAVGVDVH